ncbi:hypothetical protein NC651_022854 [Populus alba x Populus x berolinensis]|nr:hypothetical protein NC651_022840 [Populus alba x Populus x berolinensis]KAJ6896789.1 hypothetical protein NC651_022854 [Populus alba x Populus x berolinensis]
MDLGSSGIMVIYFVIWPGDSVHLTMHQPLKSVSKLDWLQLLRMDGTSCYLDSQMSVIFISSSELLTKPASHIHPSCTKSSSRDYT